MEILNNFNLIYNFIAFVSGIIFVLIILYIKKITKHRLRNKITLKFYITCGRRSIPDIKKVLDLWVGKPYYSNSQSLWCSPIFGGLITRNGGIRLYGLNPDDFEDMKEGEIREVFIKIEN